MRFLTYNLWHGLSPSTPVAFEALEPTARRQLREEMQLKLLAELKPDIAFLQEVNPVSRRAPLIASSFDADFTFQPDLVGLKLFGVGLPLNLNSGLMTAASKRWMFKRILALSLSRPGFNLVRQWVSWQLREERFALFTETMLPKWGRVLLVNTHLHHGLDSTPELLEQFAKISDELELSASLVSELRDRVVKGNKRRANEISILLKNIDRLSPRYAAVVLAGDLNSVPGSDVHSVLQTSGFRDVWAEVNPSEPGFTFDREANRGNHLLQASFPLTLMVEDLSFSARVKDALLAMARAHETRPRRIDYLWIRPNRIEVHVASARLVGMPDAEGMAPSDHFGVCADLESV